MLNYYNIKILLKQWWQTEMLIFICGSISHVQATFRPKTNKQTRKKEKNTFYEK